MDTLEKKLWLKKAAAITVLPFAALTFTGCGEDTAGPEEDVTVDDVVEPEDDEVEQEEPAEGALLYDGVYDDAFDSEYDSLIGEQVTVSAEVNEIISQYAFTIAGTEGTDVDPLLIVDAGETPEIQDGLTVAVTGTVRDAFVLVDVEEELGIDLEDELYAEWENMRYIVADNVDTSVNADPAEDQEEDAL